MSNGRTNDINQIMQGFNGMQLNGNSLPQQQMAMNGNNNFGGGYGMNGMSGMNGGGPVRRGRMSTAPGPTTGVYPYSHIGMNGKVPGANGMVSDSTRAHESLPEAEFCTITHLSSLEDFLVHWRTARWILLR